MSEILPVIMSGGSGSRLWPLSRANEPKQLLPLISDQTMIQETAQRFSDGHFTDPVFICNARHVDAIQDQMQAVGQNVDACIVEPMGRNTAPVAIIAALYAKSRADSKRQAQDAVSPLVLLAPADHHIKDIDGFRAAIAKAAPIARDGYIVTFGITPQGPETGYGYIESGEKIAPDVFKVRGFKEKPDQQTAEKYLSTGTYSWNAGIFLFAPETLLAEAATYAPAISKSAKAAFDKAACGQGRIDLDAGEFAACPPNSIDYAIMEKSGRVAVLPCDMGWNDIGSFQSLHELTNQLGGDDDGNVAAGNVMIEGASGCFVTTDSLPVSIVGVDNLAVIIRSGEVLVLNLDAAQDVKKIVTRLKEHEAQDRL